MNDFLALPYRVTAFLGRRVRRLKRDLGYGPGPSRHMARHLIMASGVFDDSWYGERYLNSDLGPKYALRDYLDRGYLLGRDPSPLFWTAWYAQAHPAAKEFGGSPLCHYLLGQGNNPNPLFDDHYYLEQSGELSGRSALSHFIREGWRQGLNPHPLFDTRWYLSQKTLSLGHLDPLTHFLTRGASEGLDPSPYFDCRSYLGRYPDVADAGTNPLVHFVLGGVRDLRNPSPDFSTARYLRRTPAARKSALHPFVHAVQAGQAVEPPEVPAEINRSYQPGMRVSAIVPNFNHALYLQERLQSIAAQTNPPIEIIILDDASTDSSLDVIRAFASESTIPVCVLANQENTGSPFRQWARGIRAAQGDLVWIAESDDRNEPDFLRAVLPAFRDPRLTLSWCQSQPIDQSGRPFARDYRDYTDDLSLERWRYSFVAEGAEEIIAALAHKNTIPNGSAVVFRKDVIMDQLDELATYRQCGDWFLYVVCALSGRVSFTPAVLNQHRRHARALTLTLESSLAPLMEALRIRLQTIRSLRLPPHTLLSSLAAIASEYYGRAGVRDAPASILDVPELSSRLAPILQITSDRMQGVSKRVHISPDQAGGRPHDGFWVLARPAPDESFSSGPSEQGMWLEGTPGVTAWSMPTLWTGNTPASDLRRIAILSDMIRMLGISVISADAGEATELATEVARRSGLKLNELTVP